MRWPKASRDLRADKDTVTAGGGQGAERIGEGLEVGQGDARERLPCPAAEAGDVGLVGALGMHGAAVEPDGDQVIVGIGLWEGGNFGEDFQGREKGDFGGHR